MKNAMIAVGILVAAALVLASAQAASNPKRDSGMAATNQADGSGVQPGGRAAKGKAKFKSQTPPTRAQPYCPYGKKADGSCWVRCSQVICL